MDTSHDIALGVPDNRPDPYLDMGRSAGTFLTPDTDTVDFYYWLVASHGLQNPWSNESSSGIPWCDESRGVIFNNPLDAILNQQQNKSGNVRHS